MVYEVYSHPEMKRYKAHIVSYAMLFQVVMSILLFLIPFVVAYRTYGFYIKEDTYREMPFCSFKYRLVVNLITSNGEQISWNSMSLDNKLTSLSPRWPVVSVREEDTNGDKFKDWLNIQVEMPLEPSEKIHGVQVALVFNYGIYEMLRINLETLALIDYTSHLPGSALHVQGDLLFKQRYPVKYSRQDTNNHMAPVIDSSSTNPSDYDFYQIVSRYHKRNLTTVYINQLQIWKSNPTENLFTINATVNYLPVHVSYMPGFWHIVKWAWIQYLSVAFITYYILDKIKMVVFENQVFRTFVQRPPCVCVTQKLC